MSIEALGPHLGPPTRFALLAAGAVSSSLLETGLRAFFPVAAYAVLAPLLLFVFRRTWRELDVDAHEHQRKLLADGGYDRRPLVLFLITALVLTLQEYYGGRDFFDQHLRPWLANIDRGTGPLALYVDIRKYGDLYSYGWWALARVLGYVFIPMALWKIVFRKDSLLDMGLRGRGFLGHAWIYLLCLGAVVPAVFIVSRSPDFGTYYPFYKLSSRSWLDFLLWESMYFAQFFALEVFFRGFWLSALRRSLGSSAIFAMCVPYCMIHYGKPFLEAAGATIAGIALGSLAMRTRSIYSGFLVHITVALLMDVLALFHRDALPHVFFAN